MRAFDKEIFDFICHEIATSMESLRKICKKKRISPVEIYRWIEDDEAVKNQYARARKEQADYYAELILEVAFDEKGDKDKFTGSNHVQRDRLKVDALKWAAAKANPKKYSEKIDVTGDINSNVTINVPDIGSRQ